MSEENGLDIPKAFVSYSHDSPEHKRWVLQFATRLRQAGVDAILDQWELELGADIPLFMDTLAESDRVLMICTERYVRKADQGEGGVGYERMIMTAKMMKSIKSAKVIPIIRQASTKDLPIFVASRNYIDFSDDDQYEAALNELVRTLHGAPLYPKPPLGNSPFGPPSRAPVLEAVHDPVRQLMQFLVMRFESTGKELVTYEEVLLGTGMRRLYLDAVIEDARARGFITTNANRDVRFEEEGKRYARQQGL